MITDVQARDVVGQTVYADDHEKIGTVGRLHLDEQSGAPQFIIVTTGASGTGESIVPAEGAELSENGLTVAFSKEEVTGAPSVAGHLDDDSERELWEYYRTAGTTAADAASSAGIQATSSDEVAQAEVATDQTELVQTEPPR